MIDLNSDMLRITTMIFMGSNGGLLWVLYSFLGALQPKVN